MLPGSRSTFPEVYPDPDTAKWYVSNRIRIQNTVYNYRGLFSLVILFIYQRENFIIRLSTLYIKKILLGIHLKKLAFSLWKNTSLTYIKEISFLDIKKYFLDIHLKLLNLAFSLSVVNCVGNKKKEKKNKLSYPRLVLPHPRRIRRGGQASGRASCSSAYPYQPSSSCWSTPSPHPSMPKETLNKISRNILIQENKKMCSS